MHTYIYSTPSTIGASIYTYILKTCIFNLGHIYTTIHTYIVHYVSRYIHKFSICAYQRANRRAGRRADRRADRRAGRRADRRADRLRAKATIVYANGVSVAYFGGNPHLGQWSFDPRMSERLTLPLGPLLVSRTLHQFLVSSCHSVLFIGTTRQPIPR